MKRLEITVGQKFNKMTVIEELPIGRNGRVFKCQCECGNYKSILLIHLVRLRIISCGCYRIHIHTKHGMWESREYSSWENMMQRCTNPKTPSYQYYGGRGLEVSSEWIHSFDQFYKDMGPRPPNTSLDRIDPEKGYFKENCKWSTRREQFVNVRRFNHKVGYGDIMMTVDDWLIELNLDRELFKKRVLRGLGFKQALFLEFDVIYKHIDSTDQVICSLSKFLDLTGADKSVVLELLDRDHEEPFQGYSVRYLADFKEWSDNIKNIKRNDTFS